MKTREGKNQRLYSCHLWQVTVHVLFYWFARITSTTIRLLMLFRILGTDCGHDSIPHQVLMSQRPPTFHTHVNSRAWFRLALPSLCFLLLVCCGFSLIWQLSWFPLWFLRDRRCGLFLFLLGRQGQWLEVVTSGLGHGVRVIQQQVMLLLVLDHFSVHSDSPEPGPGQRSWVLLTLKQIPRGHLLLCRDLKTLWLR